MELFLALGAFLVLDVAAYFFGSDSREVGVLGRRDDATQALRRGDLTSYRQTMRELDREATRVNAIRF